MKQKCKRFNGIRAELLKMKRTPILWIHFVLPLLGVLLFSLYYSRMQAWDSVTKTDAYLQAIGIIYPVTIGVVCAGTAQLEGNAGIQRMSGIGRLKETGILYKLCTLSFLSFLALALAVLGFGAVFGLILRQDRMGFFFYVKETAVIFFSVLILYMFHLFLSIQYSGAASIGAGIAESLISALFLTGLGEGLWQFVPCSYAARMAAGVLRMSSGVTDSQRVQQMVIKDTVKGAAVMAVVTVISFGLFLLWHHKFERKTKEV